MTWNSLISIRFEDLSRIGDVYGRCFYLYLSWSATTQLLETVQKAKDVERYKLAYAPDKTDWYDLWHNT